MQEVNIIIYQVVILGLVGAVGFIAGKTGYLPEEAGTVLSKIVIKLTAPLLVFTTISGYRYTDKTLHDGVLLYGVSFILILLIYLLAKITYKAMKLEGVNENIYRLEFVFGNVVFLAYPLLNSLYGEKGIFYAIFFNLANDTILWTMGIYLLKAKAATWKERLKNLANGNTIAFIAGLLSIGVGLQSLIAKYPLAHTVYQVFYDAMNPLGKTTIYLAMVFIGLILAENKVENMNELKGKTAIYCLSIGKLLLVPIVSMVLLFLFKQYLNSFIIKIVVLQLAMPSATIIAALAEQNNLDYHFATQGIFYTTLFSMFSLPLILFLLETHI